MSAFTSGTGLAGGLGLVLFGLYLANEGAKLGGGHRLREWIRRSEGNPWRSFGFGALLATLLPPTATVPLCVVGMVSTGLLPLGNALWVLAGTSIGAVTTAWLTLAFAAQESLRPVLFAVIAAGAGLRFAGSPPSRAWLGQALAGWGILLVGAQVLCASWAGLGEGVQLEALGWHPLPQVILLLCVGLVVAAGLRSSGATIVLAFTAAAAHVIEVPAAATLLIGASLGAAWPCVSGILFERAEGKRAALAQTILCGGAVALGLIVLIATMPFFDNLRESLNAPMVALALFQSLVCLLTVLAFLPLHPLLEEFVSSQFHDVEDATQPTAEAALAVPDVALESLRQKSARMSYIAHGFARSVLTGEGVSENRQSSYMEELFGLAQRVDELLPRLASQAMTPEVAREVPELARRSSIYLSIWQQVAVFHYYAATAIQQMQPQLRSTLQQVQLSTLTLLHRADLAQERATTYESCEGEYRSIIARAREVELLLISGWSPGVLHPEHLFSTLERVATLRQLAQLGLELMASDLRAEAEVSELTVGGWLTERVMGRAHGALEHLDARRSRSAA